MINDSIYQKLQVFDLSLIHYYLFEIYIIIFSVCFLKKKKNKTCR